MCGVENMNQAAKDRWRRLDSYRRNVTSQNGEDGIVERLLELLPDTPKVCLEVGAYDGKAMSNTWRLWHDLGWKAILIEANNDRFAKLKDNTAGFGNTVPINTMIAPTGDRSLLNLVKASGCAPHLGLLSLDIDANELDFFENMDGLLADIVIVEFNYDFPPDVRYRDEPGDIFFRHSAKAVEDCAIRKGYRVVACAGPNAILVRNAAITAEAALALPDLPIEAMYDHEFMRSKHPSTAIIRSKLVSEDLGFFGEPRSAQKLKLRVLTWLRRLRRRFIGGGTREPVTPARREHMRKQGFWI